MRPTKAVMISPFPNDNRKGFTGTVLLATPGKGDAPPTTSSSSVGDIEDVTLTGLP
jgi:hypothetical protein